MGEEVSSEGSEKNAAIEILISTMRTREYVEKGEGEGKTLVDAMRDGTLDGMQLLGRKSIELMSSNHLGPEIKAHGENFLPGPGYGFGLGFSVRLAPGISPIVGSQGEFAWGGIYGTYFWIDPKEELFAIWMKQSLHWRSYYRPVIKSLVLQSIVD